jgi:hypothetical protein
MIFHMRSLLLALPLLWLTAEAAGAGPSSPKPAPPVTSRATGTVVELTGDRIVVVNGKRTWDIERNERTKVFGDLRVGARVTVEYRVLPAAGEPAPVAAKAAGRASKSAK